MPKLVPLGDQNWQGGPVLAAKIGLAGPILAAKVVQGTTFGRFFCQNQSGRTDFGMTVQSYIRRVREEGARVSTQIVLGAARGILKTVDKQKLREFGGHIDISRQWALSLLRRMNFIQRKAITAKSKLANVNFKEKRKKSLMIW